MRFAHAAHGFEVDLRELLRRFHPGVLHGVIEPAGADGDVNLRWNPRSTSAIAVIQLINVCVTGV